jgi:hypothetical protein
MESKKSDFGGQEIVEISGNIIAYPTLKKFISKYLKLKRVKMPTKESVGDMLIYLTTIIIIICSIQIITT